LKASTHFDSLGMPRVRKQRENSLSKINELFLLDGYILLNIGNSK